jgi:3-phenylpropionate/trans-cinnamate dioxygenase ferredoxin subunit
MFSEEPIDDDALQEAREGFCDPPKLRPFLFACKLNAIPKNGSRGKVIFCEHDEVAVYLIKGIVYAISNICPHQLSPLLSEGYINKDELTVACPLHGWTYRIDTGASVIGSGGVPSYGVKVIGEEVWIEEPTPRTLTPIWADPLPEEPDPFD